MKKFFLLILGLTSLTLQSQTLFFSFPFQVSGPSTGNAHPRLALVNDQPLVVWGDPSNNQNLMYSHWNGNGFDTPIQLTYDDENTMLGYAEGPVVKSKGDSVYICYVSMGTNEHRVYLRRSLDGGQTFSDTILVNDRSFGSMLEYANMTLDENGNPMIIFIRGESAQNPQYVFYRSIDAGNTFTTELNATPDASSMPCECCPAAISVENDNIYLTYRNNVNNIRDFYVSISDNGGISFDSLRRMDNTNWFSNNCPASGASSIISGDSLISVYMVKENNKTMIKANTLNKTNLVAGPEYYADQSVITGSFTMNYPEIDGNGDTIGIVWQDNRTGVVKTYISVSTTGMSGLSQPQIISDFTGTVHQNPHLVFKNGIFHITWKDFGNDIVWYRKASFTNELLNLEEGNSNTFKVFPNPANDEVSFFGEFDQNLIVEIYDMNGKLILSRHLDEGKKINTEELIPGVYQIRGTSDLFSYSEKLIIQR